MDVTERSRAMLGYPVCYKGVLEGSWDMPGCPHGYMDVTKRPRVMLGYPVCYTGIMEGSWAMLGCPVVYMDVREVQGHAGLPGGFMGVMEGSRDMMGCPVRYMDITEESCAKLWCSVGFTGVMEWPMAKAGESIRVH
jgi:hypothetical protein